MLITDSHLPESKSKTISASDSARASNRQLSEPHAIRSAGSWAPPWAAYGLRNTATAKGGEKVALPVMVLIGDTTFAAEKSLPYKAKVRKSGCAK
ncbi:MAG TPA: hypothetical protein VL171_04935 [Verrucomicrobiae bacterium]|nr:hypothetical protein [Verrucomicrobiae bacterium]